MLKVTVMLGRLHELPGGDERNSIELVRMIDEAGLHGVALGEHLALGSRLDRYPYEGGLRHPEASQSPYFEPMTMLSAFSSVTSRIRLSTSILLAPLRPALLLAKQLATLDVLSGGRCEPVFGVGWQPEEYEAIGLEFSARYQILADTVAACRALWGPQPASFKSETVAFDGLFALPRPVQARIPILFGIKPSRRNVGLVAEVGDGWEAGPDASRSKESLHLGVDRLRAAFVAAGRDPQDLIVRSHLPVVISDDGVIELQRSFEPVADHMTAGVTEFALPLPVGFGKVLMTMTGIEDFVHQLGRLAETY